MVRLRCRVLAGLSEGICAEQGYTAPAETRRRTRLPEASGVRRPWEERLGCQVLAGLSEGTGAEQGCTVPAETAR